MSYILRYKSDKKIILLFFIAFFLRLFYIGNVPGNKALYVDEMIAGYGAFSLANYGFDILGYSFPVYLTSWGTGQSIMQTIWQIPWIKLFGLNSFTIRVPAAILGCITLIAFYYICYKIRGKNFAFVALFLMSIMPWHIMQSRWALDCNYFVGFVTIALAIYIFAFDHNKFLPLSYFFWGLVLYTYALFWIVMPLLIIAITIYALSLKKIKIDRYFIIGIMVLFITSLPLIIFVLVNVGLIPEIQTPFFSIPKLTHFRSGEFTISIKEFVHRFLEFFYKFINQDDSILSYTAPYFGLYYKFSIAFIFVGLSKSFMCTIHSIKLHKYTHEIYIWIIFLCSIIVSGLVDANFYRLNVLHMTITYFCAVGITFISDSIQNNLDKIIIIIYTFACIIFIFYYFTIYDDQIAKKYEDGAEYAIEYAHELITNGDIPESAKIYPLSGVSFSAALFYEKFPTDIFLSEGILSEQELNSGYIIPLKFGRYDFTYEIEEKEYPIPEKGCIYFASDSDYDGINYMKQNEMDISYFNHIVVGVYN